MTVKRFTLGVCEKGLGLTDNETKEQYLETDDTTLIRLCVLLNELHEENQSLKFQLDECQNHKLFSRRELEKENKQLQQAYNDAKKDVEKKEQILKDIMKDNLLIQDIGKELGE